MDVAGLNPTVRKTIVHQARLVDDLLGLHRSFQALRSKRCHIQGVVVEPGDRKPPTGAPKQARRAVADEAALLQLAHIGFEGNGVIPPTKIQARNIKRGARAHACIPQRLIAANRRLSGLKFKPETVIKRVALRLFNPDQNVFLRFVSLRILHRRVHQAKNTQVV